MQLETGDTADYRASANGMEVEILREDETVLAAVYESWEPIAAALRALYQQELDGFSHEPAQPEEQLAEEQPDFGNPLRQSRSRRSPLPPSPVIRANRTICPTI